MWPFRPKKKPPQLQDSALRGLAEMFIDFAEDPTPGNEILDKSRMNFTLESLGVVDQHLDAMRNRNLAGEELVKFVLRSGAYVGEVIRERAAPAKKWHWLDFDEAVRIDERLTSIGKCLGTAAVLWDGKDGFCFPLGKVGKYLENGPEDSVKFFAQVILAEPSANAS